MNVKYKDLVHHLQIPHDILTHLNPPNIVSSMGVTGGGKHQLVVLTVVSGDHFPPPPAADSEDSQQVTIRGELSDVVLVTDPVNLKSTSPSFDEQQLGQ